MLIQELSGLLPTTNPEEQTLLPYRLCTYLRTIPASPLPTPFNYSQCKFFKNNLHLSSPNCLHESLANSMRVDMCVFSTQHCCCWWFRLHAPGPGSFLASIWLDKLFLSGKFSAMNFFKQTLISAVEEGAKLFLF